MATETEPPNRSSGRGRPPGMAGSRGSTLPFYHVRNGDASHRFFSMTLHPGQFNNLIAPHAGCRLLAVDLQERLAGVPAMARARALRSALCPGAGGSP